MAKKYNVFISSTHDDLIKERGKVIETLMAMNCIPQSMELFYASDLTTWDFIKTIMLNCDYYIIIVAGMYGSICEETGKSYTHMEYDFAIENNIPISRFLYKNPDELAFNKHDKDVNVQKCFENFRESLKNNQVVKFWNTPDELACYVAISIHHFILFETFNKNNYTNKKKKDIFEKLDKIERILATTDNYNISKPFRIDVKKGVNHYTKTQIKMKDIDETSISNIDIDILCTIADISLTSGFTSMSSFLDDIILSKSVPELNMYKGIDFITDKSNNQYYILFDFNGYISGKILLIYSTEFIKKIYSIVLYKYFSNIINNDEDVNNSILYEISSIFAGNTLNNFSTIFNIKTQISYIYINDQIKESYNCKDKYIIKVINEKYSFEAALILNDDCRCKIKQIICTD